MSVNLPPIPETLKLNGKNFHVWSHCGLQSLGFKIWYAIEVMVHTWLISTLSPEIHWKFLFMKSIKEFWDTLQNSYTRTHSDWKVYRLLE